jgi:5-oxoprolinase (ATP-hydrolysing) subunit A
VPSLCFGFDMILPACHTFARNGSTVGARFSASRFLLFRLPTAMKRIDLNCDMGELPEAIADGTQEALLRSVTSANVACGGHAGDERTMRTTIEQALRAGVAIGAHPGYPDRENFGRLELKMPPDKIAESVCEQILALAKVAEECGARIIHVKPHGALYNQAVRNRELAEAIANSVAKAVGLSNILKNSTHSHPEPGRAPARGERAQGVVANGGEGSAFLPSPREGLCKDVILVGLAGSPMLDVFREGGFAVAAEAFADRRYEPDGTLRSRKFEDALIRNPEEAAWQALSIAEQGVVIASDGSEVAIDAQTICIHGDTPGSVQIAAAVARTLRDAGVTPSALASVG